MLLMTRKIDDMSFFTLLRVYLGLMIELLLIERIAEQLKDIRESLNALEEGEFLMSKRLVEHRTIVRIQLNLIFFSKNLMMQC